jgi:hypothetical protein
MNKIFIIFIYLIIGDKLGDEESYLKIIRSDEINKIINYLYDKKSNKSDFVANNNDKHSKIIKKLESININEPKYWKKLK